jgi:hypothetical protein
VKHLVDTALLCLWLCASPCLAAPASTESGAETEAKALFDEGTSASERGDQATACDKFSKSLARVRRGSTLLNLGVCETALGKLAAARRHFGEGMALLPPGDPRLGSAKERLAALDQRVARLTVRVASEAPAGSRVKLDGGEVELSALEAMILDPGSHTVVLIAAGHDDASATVKLGEGQRATLALAPGKAHEQTDARSTPDAAGAAGQGDSVLRTAGLVVGGIGLAGALAAGITGGLIVSNDGTIGSECPAERCTQDGLDAIDANKSLFVPNYIGWGVAIAGMGTGAALLIADALTGSGSAGTDRATTAWCVPTEGGLALGVRARF